jgi:esterase/lipase/1-acyl-sn-glycerol-3-phosphate acyltransferase
MRLRLYKATGAGIAAVTRLLGIRLRTTGLEELPDRPTLFVVNHFTRFETFLVPYVIYRRFRQPVHTLAKHSLFRGAFGRYLESVGVMSTRAPHRNRTIVGGLITDRARWVIYPEGGLIKNKKTVANGRLRIHRDDRVSAPHTGAAIMALKSEIRKQRYLDACRQNDTGRMSYYEHRYDLHGPDDVSPRGTILIPVNITYPGVRAKENLLNKVARIIHRSIDPHMDEELMVEGTLLLRTSEMSVHFGEPIEVADYLDRTTDLARRIVGRFREQDDRDLFLRRQARRLTGASMRSIYESTEVNFEHLFCYGLRASKHDRLTATDFHKALYLATLELRQRDDVRLHPLLENGVTALATGDPFAPLDRIVDLARSEGVLSRENGSYVIDRAALTESHGFHDIRVKKMVQVIANELEPIRSAVGIVRHAVNLDGGDLAARLSRSIREHSRHRFQREYERWHSPGISKPPDYGEPFLLPARRPVAGVVLAHGYLASPEQMRPLAEHLHHHGCTVYGVRLDGHGTSPEHLNEITWHGWMESMIEAHAVIRHHCDRVIVGGFSLGAILATLLAARPGTEVHGLFTVNAPLKLRNRLTPLVPAVVHLDTVLRALRSRRDVTRRRNESENPEINYEEDYLRGVRELRRAVSACMARLGDVTAPTLVVQSDDDPVVAPASAEILRRGLGSSSRAIVRLPGQRHVIVRGEGSGALFTRILTFLECMCGARAEPTARSPRAESTATT